MSEQDWRGDYWRDGQHPARKAYTAARKAAAAGDTTKDQRPGPMTPNPDLAKKVGLPDRKTVKGTTTPTKRG